MRVTGLLAGVLWQGRRDGSGVEGGYGREKGGGRGRERGRRKRQLIFFSSFFLLFLYENEWGEKL